MEIGGKIGQIIPKEGKQAEANDHHKIKTSFPRKTMMESDNENQIDDLVALLDSESDNDDKDVDLITSDDDLGELLDKDDHFVVSSDSDNPRSCSDVKIEEEDDQIRSLKDEISEVKARLKSLEEQLAEKELLRDSRKASSAKSKTESERNSYKNLENGKLKTEDAMNAKECKIETGTPDLGFKKTERVAHMQKHEAKMNRSGIDNVNLEKKKLNIDKKKMVKPEPEDHRPWETEQYSGIRIINPRISSQQMDSRMEGRRFIKMNLLSNYVAKGEVEGDWVTVAVIANKLAPKTAANGKTFSIWKLSDLRAGKENDTISFFLFGDIYKEHWKQNEGMVIGLLNASIMPQRHNDKIGEVAITIDNPKKLMVMGIAKDFGYCKGATKGGKQCSYIVNKFYGGYCEYHISREYKKTKAQRMEFQSGSTGPEVKKAQHMKSLKKDIESGSVYYGGKALTWKDKGSAKKKAEEKKRALNALTSSERSGSCHGKRSSTESLGKGSTRTKAGDDFDEALIDPDEFHARLQVPTTGSRNLLKFLKKDEEEEKEREAAVKIEPKSAKDLLKEQKEELKQNSKPKPSKKSLSSIDLSIPSLKPKAKFPSDIDFRYKPKLGGSFHHCDEDDEFIEFSDSKDIVSNSLASRDEIELDDFPRLRKTTQQSKSCNADEAKRKAVSLLRMKRIKLEKAKEESGKKKKSPEALAKIHERVLRDISKEDSENCEPAKKRRKGILDDALGPLDLESEEGKKILETKSAYEDLVRQADAEREAAYFNVLEKKELYEEKMRNVTEQKVTVVCCKVCRYMHQFQSQHCKEQNHMVVRVEAIKRFFTCKNCKHRAEGFKSIHVEECKNCGCTSFEKASLLHEKKGPKIGAETLMVRGEEHSKFLNSLK